ncbi:MAG: FAD-dependent oxidoreductase, partial [Bacteroidales bacterium]|nr:FAD-dependent oxidoreductase [Bacteroidales bacterium]
MNRKTFLTLVSAAGGSVLLPSCSGRGTAGAGAETRPGKRIVSGHLTADIIIAGGGLGGCAAAIAACRNGLKVIMTEETDWIGGQLSQQGVPPDEHQWIETHGAPASYREFRNRVRAYYKRNYPLTPDALSRDNLNPGDGSVSRLCHEPRVAVAVLTEMLAPYISAGRLLLLTEYKVKKADVDGDRVRSLEALDLKNGRSVILSAPWFVDATECGDLLPITGTEYVTGTESKKETAELHAPETGNPKNNQAFTLCFAMDYQPGVNNIADAPEQYDFWKNYIPQMNPPWSGKLLDLKYSNPRTLEPKELGFHPEGKPTGDALNLWTYRRIINRNNFLPGIYEGDISIVNWPQNDYFPGNIIDVSDEEFRRHVEAAEQLNLSLFYWLQTEAPRPDGGQGWPGLRLRGDIMGTGNGMAKYPYIRESRRIKAVFTVLEEHVGAENRKLIAGEEEGKRSAIFPDSVGTGYYHIDLHPSSEGDNYIDFASLPFQIPLGALLPQRINNLFPANKNIGTTHVTNGCYRLHPVEWSIGEAVGCLVAFSENKKISAKAVREKEELLEEFQARIRSQGL